MVLFDMSHVVDTLTRGFSLDRRPGEHCLPRAVALFLPDKRVLYGGDDGNEFGRIVRDLSESIVSVREMPVF